MTSTIELPKDLPQIKHTATQFHAAFGDLGYRTTGLLVDTGIPVYLRGSALTRTFLSPEQLKKIDQTSRAIYMSQYAPTPDPLVPLSGTMEYKVDVSQSMFRLLMDQFRTKFHFLRDNVLDELPSFLSPLASDQLRQAYAMLHPKNRIEWVTGDVPGKRGISFAGFVLHTDWVGVGSRHITPHVSRNVLFYNISGIKDMRNPKNMTNMELWARTRRTHTGLVIDRPQEPHTILLSDEPYKRMHKRLSDPSDTQAPWDVFVLSSRAARIGATMNKSFDDLTLTRLSKLASRSGSRFDKEPPPDKLIRDIIINLRMAHALKPDETQKFLARIPLPRALRHFYQ